MNTSDSTAGNNPLPALAKILSTSWKPALDVAVPCLFHMKLAGIEFSTDQESSQIMQTLCEVGFIQLNAIAEGNIVARLNPLYKPKPAT